MIKRRLDKSEKKIREATEIKGAYSEWMAEKETINRKMDAALIEKNKEIASLKQELESVNKSYSEYREEIGRLKEITAHQKYIAEIRSGKSKFTGCFSRGLAKGNLQKSLVFL